MCYGNQTWSEESLMWVYNDDDLHGGQRSNVVNYVLWLPNLVRRIPDASLWWWWWPSWRSKVIRGQMLKLCAMATKLSQKKPWCKFMMLMTFIKVKGHQRSNVVNFALWLPNLVKRTANASLKWWWPSWRSKRSNWFKYNKLCSMATNVVRSRLFPAVAKWLDWFSVVRLYFRLVWPFGDCLKSVFKKWSKMLRNP